MILACEKVAKESSNFWIGIVNNSGVILSFLLLCLIALGFSGCASGAVEDPSTVKGKKAILDQARVYLTQGKCDDALDLLDPAVNGVSSDNEYRMMMASAYGCKSGINYFPLLQALATSNPVGPGLWRAATKFFPSEVGDSKMEATWLGTALLMGVLAPGAILPPEYAINAESFNPGTVDKDSRTTDSNSYLFFMSLALIGSTQNRYGKLSTESFDSSTYDKLRDLPWSTAQSVSDDSTGCAYAGSVLNLFDNVGAVASAASGDISSSLEQADSISEYFGLACLAGCIAAPAALNPLGIDFNTGCTISITDAAALCNPCPLKLRHRENCKNDDVAIDKNVVACAAAGIVTLINKNADLGWPGP